MKRSRFTEAQVIGILKEAEAGAKTADLARKHAVSEHTIYRWKAKYGGMTVSEAQRLKQLEDENRRLKHLVADLTLDNQPNCDRSSILRTPGNRSCGVAVSLGETCDRMQVASCCDGMTSRAKDR